MNSLQKHSINLVLLVLVFSLLFTPLIEARASYFTGYLDLDINNKIEPDLSFFLKDNLKERLFFSAKYDSEPINNYSKFKQEKYLDDSYLIQDLSKQKEYFRADYKKYNLLYGRYNYQVKTPLFSDYYNYYKGVKFSHKGKVNKLDTFLSKSEEVSKTDKVLNPNYSVIFLSSRNLKNDSENLFVNILDKENRLLKITVLTKGKDYTIDYLNGRISFKPTIFFLNNPDYNYELIINYKIKGNRREYLNKGYQYSTHIFKNTKLKFYDISEEETRIVRGAVIKLIPDKRQSYSLEYQKLKERESNTRFSINNGDNYIKDPTVQKEKVSYGIRYQKRIDENTLFKGRSINTNLESEKNHYIEDEHQLSLSTKLNNRFDTNFKYTNRTNNLNLKEYKYQADVISRLSSKLKLNSTYIYEFDNLDKGRQTSLDNFFRLKFSENSYIYWGCLHNLTNDKKYTQYGFDYMIAEKGKFSYKNKVLDTQFRQESYKYQREHGLQLYKIVKKQLQNDQFVKKSFGLKYPINEKNSISLIKNVYNQKEISTTDIIKYQMLFKQRLTAGINYLRYELNQSNEKRSGIRGNLNYENEASKCNVQYETVKNKSNLYQKEKYDFSYEKVIKPHTLITIASKCNTENNKTTNIKKRNKEDLFKFKYRPTNKNYNFMYKYLKEIQESKVAGTLEKKNTIQQSLDFLYKLNRFISLDTGLQSHLIKQNMDDAFIKNKIQLNRFGIIYNFYDDYTFKVEYKTLYQKLLDRKDSGYLVGLQKSINDGLTLALEYNFNDFNYDISELDLKDKGFSLNLNYRW